MLVLCLYGCAGGGRSGLESIGREYCRPCGGSENRRAFVFYYDLFERTTIGTATDATGHYYLKNLPEGAFTVVMKTMGYKTVETPVTLKKGKTLEINFEAEEEALSLDGVVVSANRNETTRRMAPSLVNVLDSKMFETTHVQLRLPTD